MSALSRSCRKLFKTSRSHFGKASNRIVRFNVLELVLRATRPDSGHELTAGTRVNVILSV